MKDNGQRGILVNWWKWTMKTMKNNKNNIIVTHHITIQIPLAKNAPNLHLECHVLQSLVEVLNASNRIFNEFFGHPCRFYLNYDNIQTALLNKGKGNIKLLSKASFGNLNLAHSHARSSNLEWVGWSTKQSFTMRPHNMGCHTTWNSCSFDDMSRDFGLDIHKIR